MEDGGLEEERRLFYVAVTRAKRQLYLTHPSSVGRDFSYEGPSRFLEEVDPNCLDGSCSGFGSAYGSPLPSKFIPKRSPVDDYSQPGHDSAKGEDGVIVLDSDGEPVGADEMRQIKERVKKMKFLGDY